MQRDIQAYFEQAVIPLIAKEYPEVASEMSIQIGGSFGLGVHDEISDLEADIQLDDELWKTHGGQVQLMLEHRLQQFAPHKGHAEIFVYRFSRLLDGHAEAFLEIKADAPWEKVAMEDLYQLQENLVLRDPHNMFRRLREATAPERFPEWLWKKLLILKLGKLRDELGDLERAVARGKMLEAHIVLGCALEVLLRLGFIINKRYYPWRKHLRWAFAKLPVLASRVLPDIEVVVSSLDWDKKVASMKAIRDIYIEYIRENNILTPEILEDLVWAERCEAWYYPNWRDFIAEAQQKAKEAGYDASDFWVFTYWGWVSYDEWKQRQA